MKIARSKLVVVGPISVGKTSLITRYVSKVFTTNPSGTVGVSFCTIDAYVRDIKVKLQVWDTAGQERFRAMSPLYYRGADAALLVFDVTSRKSFEELKSLAEEIHQNFGHRIPIFVIVGNKIDNTATRKIKYDEALNLANEIKAKYFETSAKTGSGVFEAFEYICKEIANGFRNESVTDVVYMDEVSTKSSENISNQNCCSII